MPLTPAASLACRRRLPLPDAAGWFVLLAGALWFGAATPTAAAEQAIYQQRLPDGQVVITDRPVPGAVILKTWNVPTDDPAQAAARRAAAQQEAAQTAERVQRNLESRQQLDTQLEIERLRRDQAQAELAAERERSARAQAESQPVWVVPGRYPVAPPIGRPPWLQPPAHPAPPPSKTPRRPPDKPASLLVEPPPHHHHHHHHR
ncbi:hypothetical protein [Caldimonas brevitalea]|uniref:Translation initiation factor n=1 Tax=Caldimonas brevitalea TaxID=413882 RepID=A0A0G3BWP7_9BURK|nr:hypothetical protein [Caldimonas brevitalea]AKJ31781.1 translation initiation factor [Caldimonas brevitalea]